MDDSARFCRGALVSESRRARLRRRRPHVGEGAAVPADNGRGSGPSRIPRQGRNNDDIVDGPAQPAAPPAPRPNLPAPSHTARAHRPNHEEGASAPPRYPARPDPLDPAAEVWQLVERAQAGDDGAFGQIYDRYVDTVFRFVYFRVGNREVAEDLTSDTFLRAFKRIGSFTWQGRDVGAWLVTIARNLVADHFKSGRYRLEVTTGEVLDANREDHGPEGRPESSVVDHITNVALLTAVKQLNPEQQECIVLRFLQGLSVAETAQTMGKNEGAIKALQYRAVRALGRLLPEGFEWTQPSAPEQASAAPTDTPAHPTPAAPITAPPTSVDVAAASDLENDNIITRVQALPDQQRAIFTMIVGEGKTAAEVAQLTGLARSTVRVHLSRANSAIAAQPRRPQPQPTPRRRYIATDFSGLDSSPRASCDYPKGSAISYGVSSTARVGSRSPTSSRSARRPSGRSSAKRYGPCAARHH